MARRNRKKSSRKASPTKDAAPAVVEGNDSEPTQAASLNPLAEAEAKRNEYLALAQRVQADFDNFRKRTERDMSKLKRESLGAFLQKFLAAFDNLDRAIQEEQKSSAPANLLSGVLLVRESLWQVMAASGVTEINALGETFNPAHHEAMTAIPSPDHAPNTVIEVFQTGYTLDDFVLRPAKVIVAAAAPADAT